MKKQESLVEEVWKDNRYVALLENIKDRFTDLCLMYPNDENLVNKATAYSTETLNDVEEIVDVAVRTVMKDL